MEESSGVNVVQFAKARASEIASLMNDVNRKKKANAAQNLPPHMRRRAASHNPKRIPRKFRVQYEKYHAETKSKKAPKKIRKQQQKKKHEKQAKNYPVEYANRSRPGELWLGTHIWHAKRCKMDTLWGYKLPIHCNDKKLGATHQAVTKHAMLLDLSYYCCISLEGPEEKLLGCLSSLTDSNSGSNFASATYLDGLREGHAYVYHPFKFPYEAIGLVTFIWKPVTNKSSEIQKSKRSLWIWCHPSFHEEFVGVLIEVFKLKEVKKESITPTVENVKETDEENVTFNSKVNLEKVRQHFFKEDVFISEDIQMTLLKDKLVRHRIIGPNAQNVVSHVLETADVGDMSPFFGTATKSAFRVNGCREQSPSDDETQDVTKGNKLSECISESKRTGDECYPVAKKIKLESEDCEKIIITTESNSDVKNGNELPKLLVNGTNTEINSDIDDLISSEMLSRPTVETIKSELQSSTSEKQCWWKQYYNNERAKSVQRKGKKLLEHLRNSRSGYYIAPSSVIGLTVRDPRLILSRNKEKFVSTEDNESESVSNVVELLTEDIADSPLWNCHIRDEVTATQIPESDINNERAKYVVPSESVNLGDKESRVPILLIHQPGTNGFGCGWDLIAPLGWSMAFWIPLILNGGRATGLRDLHFVNLEIGQPSIPLSYPDTKAGEKYEEKQRIDELTAYYKRPKAKRTNFATFGTQNPFFMPWNVLIQDWLKELKSYQSKIFFYVSALSPNLKLDISESDLKNLFFVLRQKEVRLLQNLCDRLNRLPRGNKALGEIENLKKLYDELVLCTLTAQNQLKYSLVLIKTKCLSRGCPTIHSGVYALDESDMKEVKCNPNFLGPKEPNHTKSNKGDKLNSEVKESSKKSDSQTSPECQTDPKNLDRPQIQTLKSFSSHKMIGYLSEGGFSSISGKGCGIGHCSLIGLLCVIRNCIQHQLRPVVLVREQHSFQYRVSSLEIIPNYL